MPEPIESIDAYVARIVRNWPALEPEQRQRLELLLSHTEGEPTRERRTTD
jgi:hypothetical protein